MKTTSLTPAMHEPASEAPVRCSAWLDGNPPKNGTTIVAIGRVIWRDEYSTSVSRFVDAIVWLKDQSGYDGWHFDSDGMTVARTLDDEVMVDWWLPMPSNYIIISKELPTIGY